MYSGVFMFLKLSCQATVTASGVVVLDVISSHFRRCGHSLEVWPLDGLPSPSISPFHFVIVSGSCWSLLAGRNSSRKVGYLEEDPQSLDFYLSFLCPCLSALASWEGAP